MRYVFFAIETAIVFALASCANCPYQVSRANAGVRVASVCEISHWDKAMVGTYVQVRAQYVTDFHHGSFLSDNHCPHDSLPVGKDAANVGNSISGLQKYMGEHFEYFLRHGIKVDIIGIYVWKDGYVINKDLPSSRQVHVAGRGQISLVEVRSFTKKMDK